MKSLNATKSHRLLDFVPSLRPSFLSVMLVFVCGCLWLKNETTNERLIALQSRIDCLPCVKMVKTVSFERMTRSSTKFTPTDLYKKMRTHFSEGIPHTSGLPVFIQVPPSLAAPVQRTTFQVTCQAEGFPRPTVNWNRVGMPLPAGRVEVNQGTLTIKNLSPADSGLYECIATNMMGTKKTRTNVAVQRHSGLEDSVIVGNKKNHLTSLGNWLAPVATGVYSRWKRCWRASVDGWAARTFHSRCDGKGPTVTIIRVGKYIFGGYTSRSWDSSNRYQYDSKAFLFSLVNKPGWAPVKLPQTGEYSSRRNSIYCFSSYGPTFGEGYDILIYNYASSNSHSYGDLGYIYSPPSGYNFRSTFARTFLAGSYKFTPDEVETFYETN